MVDHRNDSFLYAGSRVGIRRLSVQDQEEFTKLVNESGELLFPWVILPETPTKFDEYIKRFDGVNAECILICELKSGSIVGTVSIVQILRGPYERGTIGYNSFAPWVGRGYMFEGLSLVFQFAFDDLGLHRLEADIQPDNKPSLRLAAKVGFRREGYSPAFIYVHGAWRDHERWAIIREMTQKE
jgi:ribosomal-protein-alanine N-acetyltransferase